MRLTKTLRLLLSLASLVAIGIGASLLLDPAAFHASNGIRLSADPSLLSEVRAPGGALLALGLLIGLGVFRERFLRTSTVVAATVYWSYGVSRLVAVGLDGVPAPGLVGATAIELAIGVLSGVALWRATGGIDASPTVMGEEVA